MGRLSWIIRELWHSVGGKTFNLGVGEESDDTVGTSQGAQLAEKDKEPDPPQEPLQREYCLANTFSPTTLI